VRGDQASRRSWRRIARDLGCDPDGGRGAIVRAMVTELAKAMWASGEAELELAEFPLGTVGRSDRAVSRAG